MIKSNLPTTVWKTFLKRYISLAGRIKIKTPLNVNSKAAEWQTRNLHFYMLLVALLLTSPICLLSRQNNDLCKKMFPRPPFPWFTRNSGLDIHSSQGILNFSWMEIFPMKPSWARGSPNFCFHFPFFMFPSWKWNGLTFPLPSWPLIGLNQQLGCHQWVETFPLSLFGG